MSQSTVIGGPSNTNASNYLISVTGGTVNITGNSDTISTSAANVGINVKGTGNFISVSGAHATISAGPSINGAVAQDSLLLSGNYAAVIDNAFNNGSVTISGNNNNMGTLLTIETMNLLVSGNNDTVSNQNLTGDIIISGNYDMVTVGAANVTVSGQNDTVVAAKALRFIVSGGNAVVTDEAAAGVSAPLGLLSGPSSSSVTAGGSVISITGANANVTAYNDGDTISSSGNSATVAALSYVNSLVSSGDSANISTAPVQENVTVSGASPTVSTSFGPGPQSTLPAANVVFTGVATVNPIFNNGATNINDSVGSSVPASVNINSHNATVQTGNNYTYTDTIGGNKFNYLTGAKIILQTGNDTVSFLDNTFIPGAGLTVTGGSSASHTTLVLGNNDYYNGYVGTALQAFVLLDVTGNNNAGVVYAASQDSLNVAGHGNFFTVEQNLAAFAGSVTGGGSATVNGANTVAFYVNNYTVTASTGATIDLFSSNNDVTIAGSTLTLEGNNNSVVAAGSDTIFDANPYNYQPNFVPGQTAQSFFTVQSGVFQLGGLDHVVQNGGTAQISLFGGNNATLAGSNDTIHATTQVYGGDVITDNGTGSQYVVTGVDDAAVTIAAVSAVTVKASDDTASKARIGFSTNYNTNEQLNVAVSGTTGGTSINAAGTNFAVQFSAGSSSNNTVYGGTAGGNTLSGGTGAGDVFVAGGNGDSLTAGTGGAATLVSGSGTETLTGSGLSNDVLSILGGGANAYDVITKFGGQVNLANGLTTTSQSVSGGNLNLVLSDGTTLHFVGLTALTQSGNVFIA